MGKGAHCQVPCGIFNDPKMVQDVREICATVTKAISQIGAPLGAPSPQLFNQSSRWVRTKDEHCDKLITMVSKYCLCQRVKPFGSEGGPFKSTQDYIDALTAHHMLMVAAMKAKQTTHPAAGEALVRAAEEFCKMYLPVPKTRCHIYCTHAVAECGNASTLGKDVIKGVEWHSGILKYGAGEVDFEGA